MSECVVIGGGVAGLLSCYALAVSGARVCLLERAEVGRESSWAGGGIVSPLYPWRYAAAVQQLAIWSQRFYPALGERLLRESGLDPEVYTTGLYWLDLHDADAALVWGAAHAGALREVCMSEVYDKLPNLRRGFSSAVFSSDVANVRNPKLLKALASSLRQMPNVRVLENAKVEKLALSGGRVAGVLVGGELLAAEKVIIAAGAWSAELLVSLGFMLPVAPVKGQMILYKCEPDFLPAMVLAEERYAIPRRDGHVLVGSTLEHVGFDKTPTEGALVSLKVSAEKMLPGLAQREVVGHWAGLRPGSPDGIPFIGEVQEVPGLWLNCGHYRNGLVLAPASCELLKNLMLGEVPIVDPLPYSPAGRLGIL